MITPTSAVTSRSHFTRSSCLLRRLLSPLVSSARVVANWLEAQDILIDKKYRKLDAFTQLSLHVYSNIRGLDSMRDMARASQDDAILRQAVKMEAMGKSALCDANNESRANFFDCVVTELCDQHKSLLPPQLPERFGPTEAVDGSVFGCTPSMIWARYTTGSKAIKLHMSYDFVRRRPLAYQITPAACSERDFLPEIIRPGVTFVADRGYPSIKHLRLIDSEKAFFVIRLTKSFRLKTIRKLPFTGQSHERLLDDRLVRFQNSDDEHKDEEFRLVAFRNHKGERITVLTNRKDLSTADIAFLYRRRWKVELFFRALKKGRLNTQKRIHWIGKSEAAVRIQIAAMMIAYLLLLLITAHHHTAIEIPRALVQIVRSHLHLPHRAGIRALDEAARHLGEDLKPPEDWS